MPQSNALLRATHYFENLSLADVSRMNQIYTEDAYFCDPFNEVRGIRPIAQIFEHMFAKVDEPRFKILTTIEQDYQAFLTWDFLLRFKGESVERKIHGGSHLRFATDGRIQYHRDYWDAAHELYEQLPLVGGLMRFLKRQANK